MKQFSPTVIDLFCGAGGLSEGFRQAGFQVIAGNDSDKLAAETFASTHQDAVFLASPRRNCWTRRPAMRTTRVGTAAWTAWRNFWPKGPLRPTPPGGGGT
ncbi:MAG: DNA cytosine methyltransferase [Nitrospinota bacterium]